MKIKDVKAISLYFIYCIFIMSCNTVKPTYKHKIKSFETGKYSTSTSLGGYNLEFKKNNQVLYNWKSDILGFNRIGKYQIESDTITILYEPLLAIKKINKRTDETIFQFRNKQESSLQNCNIKLFQSGKILEKLCDKNGKVTLYEKIETIDSLYFNWNFLDFGIYPIEHKFVPNKDKINGELASGFVQLDIILEEDLIGHPVSSNEYKLLIIGPNELFPGLDYDPETIYLGGILKKTGK